MSNSRISCFLISLMVSLIAFSLTGPVNGFDPKILPVFTTFLSILFWVANSPAQFGAGYLMISYLFHALIRVDAFMLSGSTMIIVMFAFLTGGIMSHLYDNLHIYREAYDTLCEYNLYTGMKWIDTE